MAYSPNSALATDLIDKLIHGELASTGLADSTTHWPSLLFLGDGPHKARDLERFYSELGADSYTLNSDWGRFFGVQEPWVVLGKQAPIDATLISLLHDAFAVELDARTGVPFSIDPNLELWGMEKRELEGTIYFLRTPNIKRVKFISQEDIISCLLSGESTPRNRHSGDADHPLLSRIDFLIGLINGESFRWPSTVATVSGESLLFPEWPDSGLLSSIGYKVGASGEEQYTRRAILSKLFLMGSLPRMGSHDYLISWGGPCSAKRLRKMAESIAAFCRNAKRRTGADMRLAIDDWESDLTWLKMKYYVGRFDRAFRWPGTDPR